MNVSSRSSCQDSWVARVVALIVLLAGLHYLQVHGDEPKQAVKGGQEHKFPTMDGHKLRKIPIYLSEALAPGKHDLGAIEIEGIGKVTVAVDVTKGGSVSEINVRWPKEVTPKLIGQDAHDVFTYSRKKGLAKAGKAKCENIHAAGKCDGCCIYYWFEVVQVAPK